jgi:hypothetical protein
VFARNRSQPARERTVEERQRAREERERRRQGLPQQPNPPSVEETPTVEVAAVQKPVHDAAALSPAAGPPPKGEAAPAEHPPLEASSHSTATSLPVEGMPRRAAVEEMPRPAAAEETSHTAAASLPTGETPRPAVTTSAGEPRFPPELPSLPIEQPQAPPEPVRPTASRRSTRLGRRVERLHKRRANAHRWYRRLPARLGAVLALAAVGGAIWLLVQSLVGSSHPAPPPLPHVIKITIPEGFTRAQTAALAKSDHLNGSYLDASVHSSLVHPTRYGAPGSTPNLEGFLFPATYEIYSTSSSQHLVDEQQIGRAHV